MRAARLLSLFLFVTPAWCGTQLFMHEVTSPVVGYRYATSTVGQGTVTSVTRSVAGPTSGVQLTKTAGGPVLVWISPPLSAATTISGAVAVNAWAKESSTTCNCGLQVTLQKYSNGAESAAFLNSMRGVALTTTFSQQNWSATPTSTSFAAGDRIVVKWWISDAGGTMNSGKNVSFRYDSNSTWVQFAEALSFQSEPEIIQNKNGHVQYDSFVTVNLNPTGAGHALVVVITADGPTYLVTSVTDNGPLGSCSYVEAPDALNAIPPPQGGNGQGAMTDIWYCPNSLAGATSVAVTVYPATNYDLTAWVYEVSGLDTNSPLDVSGRATDSSNSTSHAGVSLTTAQPMEFLVEAAAGWENVTAVSSPWTLDATPGGDASVYLTAGGTVQPTFTNSEGGPTVMSAAAFKPPLPNQPPSVDAGPNQTITWPTNTVMLNGMVTDDGLPNHTLTISWSQVSGPATATFSSPSSASTRATFPTVGTYVLRLSANDSQYTSSATVTVTVSPEPVSLTLSPPLAGPDVVGTSQTFTALLKAAGTGAPISGAAVQFTVTGPNATCGTAMTDNTGTATFTYRGNVSGTDTVQATTTQAAPGGATLVQSAKGMGGVYATSVSATLPQPITAGNQLIVVVASGGSASSISISDTLGNTFTSLYTDYNVNYQVSMVASSRPSTDTVTMTVAAGSYGVAMYVLEYAGIAGLDAAAFNRTPEPGTDLSLTTSVTTTQPNDLLLAFDFRVSLSDPNLDGAWMVRQQITREDTGDMVSSIIGDRVADGAGNYSATTTRAAGDPPTWTYYGWFASYTGMDLLLLAFKSVSGNCSPGSGVSSNTATVGWVVPAQPISTNTVYGRFFFSDGSATFDTPQTAMPAFSQFFPTINFNPPSGTIPGMPAGVGVNTRPFTDVTTDLNGNFTGTMVAQGNGLQAGVGALSNFQAVFTGTLTIATAGNITFGIYSDDAFILGIGSGATRVSGPMWNVPSSGVTPFESLPIMGAFNDATLNGPGAQTVVVNFPAPGSYSYELDYTECCTGQLTLTMTQGATNATGVAPTGSLALSPTNPPALNAGQTQTFTVLALDASGAAVQNVSVRLTVYGANQLSMAATTDATGHATFQYAGTNAGTDSIQASTIISGMGTYSNSVNMTWAVVSGGGGGGSEVSAPQGWIGSPTNGAIIQGQVPITVPPSVNLTSGTLSYWPLSNPNAVTTLNANTTGSGTIGTFDGTLLPNGGYAIQLNAVANGTPENSYITVTVVGDNKPGRITSTVTDLKVPLAGIPISIARTYDSLERGRSEDFGFGWKLGTTVGLTVDLKGNVTFNFNGQRETFYFLPQPQFWLFPWMLYPQYVPQAGLHGTLTSDGCSPVWLVQASFYCLLSTNLYQPTTYFYTDPSGRTYTISASGQLQSVKDLSGNTLTITPNGITSSVNGVVIPFVRDGSGRITQITDLNGNHYAYSYDSSGNLQSVQYPGLTAAETYAYASDHSLLTETDPGGNASSATYYPDGRLQSITGPQVSDGQGNPTRYVTQYAYNVSTNTTAITNPDGGIITHTDDSFGKPLTITQQIDATTSRTTTYQYDANENLVRMVDPLNNPTTYTYDANGFVTSVQLPGLPASSKTYNQFGGVMSETDAAQTNTVTTTYDANFNPVQVTDLLNGAGTFVSSFTYDAMGNVQTYTDANHKTTTYDYDPNGYLVGSIDALNESTRYTYDPMGHVATITDPRNKTTQYFYDQLGRPSKVVDANNVATQFLYDNNGNKTDEIDAVGTPVQRTTHYDYDALNRVSKITYPDLTTKQFFYDFRGNKVTEIDQSGRTTKYAYDLAGQLTSVTYAYGIPDVGTVSYSYYLDGKQKTVTDERGNVATNFYDAARRLTSVQDALQHSTSFGYDADSRRTSVTDANLNTTGYQYDARGRLGTITYPSNPATSTRYAYDGMGHVLTATDQAGKVTTKTYDDVGRLKSVTDAILPTGNTTAYAYDLSGNLLTITDAANRTTSFQYDNLNHRSVRTLPLQQSEFYSYDSLGNLQHKRDFNGYTTSFTYDGLDRLLLKIPDPSLSQPTISFTYTPTGQRASMSYASGSTTYTYDNRDRLKIKATPEGTLSYTYDAHGNVLTIASSNADGAAMTYSYDVLNRLATVTDNRLLAQGATSAVTSYNYDPVSSLAGYTYPNTVQTSYTYDALNRLTQMSSSKGGVLASYAYTLGAAGNRLAVAEMGGRTVNYGYDNDYRLTSEAITGDPAGNNGTVSYTQYDGVGNRTQMASTLNAVPGGSFSYDANDRLTTDNYDANGNTVSSGGISYTYDFENRLLMSGAALILYDGDGNRVSETAGGVTTEYLVDVLNPTGLSQIVDEVVNGTVTRTYAYGLQRVSENQLISGTWTPSFYGYDGHGNVRFLANSAGAVTDTYQFDAFGNQIASTGTTPNSFLYSGEQFDSSTSMYQLRARWYRPTTGRFITRDPVEGQVCSPLTLNPYVYAGDDPVDRVDPTGAQAIVEYALLLHFLAPFKVRTCKSHECPGRACYIDNCTSLNGPGGTAVQGFDCVGDKDCCIDEFDKFAAKCKARNWPGYPTQYKPNYDPGARGNISGECCKLY